MKRFLLVLVLVGLLMALALPAFAVIHVTVPADECAPAHSSAVSNDRFEQNVIELGLDRPLGGFKQAPTSCPAPNS